MRWIIERLFGWDQVGEDENFAQFLSHDEARIGTANGQDVGWIRLLHLPFSQFMILTWKFGENQIARCFGRSATLPLPRPRFSPFIPSGSAASASGS
jgi:hypothetical protein